MRFVKGHGTENDFVVVPDLDGAHPLSAATVVALCDRRRGIGADGVLRVVRAAADPESAALAGQARWFMDYRNADGSIAEMCGNGIRVFARFLVAEGLEQPGSIPVVTRAGLRRVQVPLEGPVTVEMGRWRPLGGEVEVRVEARRWSARGLSLGNPHAVVPVAGLAEVGALGQPPTVGPAEMFPDGVNVEFVAETAPGELAMRVWERGVGETRSCGTGACAAAVDAALRDGARWPARYLVDVPGGRLAVEVDADGQVWLTGPAVLVAAGEVRAEALAASVAG